MTIDELKLIVIEKFKRSLIDRNKWSKVFGEDGAGATHAVTQEGGMIIAYGDIIKLIDPEWQLPEDFRAY